MKSKRSHTQGPPQINMCTLLRSPGPLARREPGETAIISKRSVPSAPLSPKTWSHNSTCTSRATNSWSENMVRTNGKIGNTIKTVTAMIASLPNGNGRMF